mmetsp:Transcript_6535/g.8088  ORF Transcript_6535/g.8088 Transcript_6535/m.8088 type:complete len:105 (-) Transcript_6535:250-564(-)|eukprot:CAMPEP_0185779318 /NCGR_PEP_ID=MMETSP1174-20130828/95467_1 /TAXON_ID=35687 /ORGANISM="Dictyocha speculum, Strain CCMP1381" /LENGTH=104 /DNA_ID=CAMNT_0028468421 /DNA_START=52 /DNA_END=366 /DNA_ORIENTATION=-
MTRGNQREVDRQRAQNRAAKYKTVKLEGSVQSRNENDAGALQRKIAEKKQRAEENSMSAAAEEKQAANIVMQKGKTKKKKKDKTEDLLSAGLAAVKPKATSKKK